MRSFNRLFAIMIIFIILIFASVNAALYSSVHAKGGRPYRVEVNRIALEIEKDGPENVDLRKYQYVTNVVKFSPGDSEFYHVSSDYAIREINGELYRFDFSLSAGNDGTVIFITNMALAVMSAVMLAVLLFVREKVIRPFDRLKEVPYELSKGNLTAPLKESKSRFFGRFIWGVDLLRESIEQQKERELHLQREKKTLLLSLSHDIKTPLSAIKLYAKALSKGLWQEEKKIREAAENINARADEIERFVSQIVSASREEFLSLDVKAGEFYLSEMMKSIADYYAEKLSLIKTDFTVGEYTDCLLKGDLDRGIEVLQNVIENAVKYGDGREISICFSEEEGGLLVSVRNSGCTLSDTELPHIFDSFWRGSNIGNSGGSGLGLYICRQLMRKMGGEIYAETEGESVSVTAVFVKA